MALAEDQWQTLVLKACDDDGRVAEEWDSLWARTASLDLSDGSGELRFRSLVVMGLELMVAGAVTTVSTSEGGGQSGQWGQYFDHLIQMLKDARTAYETQLRGVQALGARIKPMTTVSLTPVDPGQIDPASPGYLGDPRYRRLDSPGFRW